MPEYLADMPLFVTGWAPQPFQYHTNDGETFRLGYPVHDLIYAEYFSDASRWVIDD